MNSSQMLYKISNLQYSIRMKQAEYAKAISVNDQPSINLNSTALLALQEDLDKTTKAFNSLPSAKSEANIKASGKTKKWWKTFFALKIVSHRK